MVALVVEDGSNVTGANSYVDIDFIRGWASARMIELPASDDAVSAMAINAMDYLEGLRSQYQGKKTYADQELQWPRSGVVIDCLPWPDDSIPKELKNAQAQLVLEQIAIPDLSPSTDGYAVSLEKVDVIEVEYAAGRLSGTATSPAKPSYPKVQAFLNVLFYCCGAPTMLKVRRA